MKKPMIVITLSEESGQAEKVIARVLKELTDLGQIQKANEFKAETDEMMARAFSYGELIRTVKKYARLAVYS